MNPLKNKILYAFREGTAEELAVALALVFKLPLPTSKTNDRSNFLKTAAAAQSFKNSKNEIRLND